MNDLLNKTTKVTRKQTPKQGAYRSQYRNTTEDRRRQYKEEKYNGDKS